MATPMRNIEKMMNGAILPSDRDQIDPVTGQTASCRTRLRAFSGTVLGEGLKTRVL